MKKILLISILILTASITVWGQDTIYSIAYNWPQPESTFEYRDSANYFYFDTLQVNNIWQIGTPSKTIFNNAYSVPLALLTDTLNTYPDSTKSSFEFVIFTDDYTNIDFWHKYDTDSLKDGGIVEVSTNDGATWTNIILDTINGFSFINFYSTSDTIGSLNNSPGFIGNSGGWIKSTIMKSGAIPYYRFRFTFSSDSIDNNKDGWMIDNFSFTALGTGVENLELESKIKLYPNPTINQLSIEIEGNLKLKNIKVYDISSQLIYQGIESIINTSQWTKGLYLIEIETDQEIIRKKVIK
jgi:type IX secretion system substrate protein